MNRLLSSLLAFALTFVATDASAATIQIINADALGQGLNDATPATPVAGNPGTTLGAQRLALFQHAAQIWASKIESTVPIRVRVSFPQDDPNFGCATTPGAFVYLGFAGPMSVWYNFPNAPRPNVLYPVALRNALAGDTMQPETPEIQAKFNPQMDLTPGCLTSYNGFWYGLDPTIAPPDDRFPLLPLVLHELAHGLASYTATNLANGEQFLDSATIYDLFLFDLQQARFWDEMNNAQRTASATNDPNLVWAGSHVQYALPSYVRPPLRLRSGATPLNGVVQPATFGALVPREGLSGQVVAATPADACAPLSNAAQVAGKIVLIDRGTCLFHIKSRHAEQAGAIAVMIGNITPEGSTPVPILSGNDYTLTRPSVALAHALAQQVKAQIQTAPGTVFTLDFVPGQPDAGARNGMAQIHAPATLSSGSSVMHFSTAARGRMLMLPSINTALFDHLDLTPDLLRDIGWTLAPGAGHTVFFDDFE